MQTIHLTSAERRRLSSFLNLRYPYTARLESNSYNDPYGRYEWLLAASATEVILEDRAGADIWEKLELFSTSGKFGLVTLSYDLKNTLEDLDSSNPDSTQFPEICLWEPEILVAKERTGEFVLRGFDNAEALMDFIASLPAEGRKELPPEMLDEPDFEQYRQAFEALKKHILRGDIYEVNLCRQEIALVKNLDPDLLFEKLNDVSPAPFACLYKVNTRWLICTSPERFLNKSGKRLISQPIKGTARRFSDPLQDLESAKNLRNNPKEQAENVMIVDLVRNDLSHFAEKGSVIVKELFGIYPFPAVHQMISTIEAQLKSENKGIRALAAAFPMGSMTGAPKISAMKLIEKYESFRRGIYSGATGYINEQGDFDFNVVIRSFVWNSETGVLGLAAGSAITMDAEAEKEFEECRLKAAALWKSLKEE